MRESKFIELSEFNNTTELLTVLLTKLIRPAEAKEAVDFFTPVPAIANVDLGLKVATILLSARPAAANNMCADIDADDLLIDFPITDSCTLLVKATVLFDNTAPTAANVP